jgi:mannose-6-phosphate isomerase-like protein (cupin superfamily)
MTIATPTMPDELNFLGARVRIVADGESTGGRLGLVDMLEVPPGDMPPLHVHHSSDEGFYVLDGELTVHMPGVERTLRAGEFLLAPRAVPHTYRVGDGGCRVLVTSLPAGFERFVAEVSELGVPDPERLTQVAADHDIEILGPPGMLPGSDG